MVDTELSPGAAAAVDYVGHGFAVIPLKPESKEPATTHGRDDWCDDADSVARQFREVERSMQANYFEYDGHWCNVGIVCGQPSRNLLVIDIDRHEGGADGFATLAEWERDHGPLPETVTSITGGGGKQLFYLVDRVVTGRANSALGVDLRYNNYVVAPPSIHPGTGEAYEWSVSPDDMDVARADANVNAFVDHLLDWVGGSSSAGASGDYEPPESLGHGERNDGLFRYGCHLRGRGADDATVCEELDRANREVCETPLGDRELATIKRSVCRLPVGMSEEAKERAKGSKTGEVVRFEKKGEERDGGREGAVPPQHAQPQAPWAPKGNVFLHNLLAKHLINEFHACYIEGMPAIWRNDHYEVGEDAVKRVMTELHDPIKESQRKEVMRYLSLKLRPASMPQADPRYIQFSNGVLDIETLEMRGPGPDLLIPNVVPHRWNPGASCGDLDRAVAAWSCGDPEVESQIWEMIGMCLYRGRKAMNDCPVLIGSGSNGKSTLLNLLHRVLGEDNVSSLDLADVGKRFQSVAMMGKLANLGDDIANEFITGSEFSVAKKAITGDWIGAEYKGGETFQYRPYATQIFSCNEMPRLGDSSDGVFRRFKPVPLLARFDAADGTKDIGMEARLSSEECCEYACLMGVVFLGKVLSQGGMTVSAKGAGQLSEIRRDNSTVIQFMEDERGYGSDEQDSIDGAMTSEVYREYSDYCERSGTKRVSRNKFTREICRVYALRTKNAKVSFATGTAVRKIFSSER